MEVIISENLPYVEEWKNLTHQGFEHYQVSNYGRVRNQKNGCIRRAKDNGHGYLNITLKSHGNQLCIYIHREVARLFLPDFDEALQVNHKNKNKLHNYVSNLEMMTDSENKLWSKDEYIAGHLQAQGKILQVYDMDGNLILEHFGLWDFCRKYNYDSRSIQRVIRGQKKSYRGLTFKYREIG